MLKRQTLAVLNIPQYVLRKEPSISDVPSNLLFSQHDNSDESMLWECLAVKVKACDRCDLAKSRTQTVFGTGDKHAKLMLIGEAPGMNEDKQGLPFVGRAGQLLTQMLLAIGLARDDVYIANMIKCRPPNNRDPKPEEISSCADYLQQQVALVKPKLIVALGRIAAQGLLNVTTSLSRLRGIRHRYADGTTPMLVTYHPAYLLRNPADKRKALEDWLAIQHFLDFQDDKFGQEVGVMGE